MRKLIKDFLNKEEIEELSKIPVMGHTKASKAQGIPKKIIDKVIEETGVSLHNKSNFFTFNRKSGNKWHQDTGLAKLQRHRMLWCRIGISILLRDCDWGGELYYADDDKETNKVKLERGVGDLCFHSSDEWHMVTPHSGERLAFLAFL